MHLSYQKKLLCTFVKSTFNSFKFVKSIYLEDEMVYVSLDNNDTVMSVEAGDPHPRQKASYHLEAENVP